MLSRQEMETLLAKLAANANRAKSVRDALHEAVHVVQIVENGGCVGTYDRNDIHDGIVDVGEHLAAERGGPAWYVLAEVEARAVELAASRAHPDLFGEYDPAQWAGVSALEMARDGVCAPLPRAVFVEAVGRVSPDRVADLCEGVRGILRCLP